MIKKNEKRSRIWKKMFKLILIISFFLTLLFTFFQGVIDYSNKMKVINNSISQIEKSQINSIVTSLWSYNEQELNTLMDGLLHFPYINFVAIKEYNKIIISRGVFEEQFQTKELPLLYKFDGKENILGSFTYQINKNKMMQEILFNIIVILIFQMISVLIVAFLIFFMFEFLVTRYLFVSSEYFKNLDLNNLEKPLYLNKKVVNDEIDILVNSFNEMRQNLAGMYKKLFESEERFRVLVEHAPEAIVVYDVNTNTFVTVNMNAEKLFGRSHEDLIGSSIFEFYTEHQPDGKNVHESVKENTQRALSGESVVFDRLIKRADGDEVLCEVRLVMLPSEEKNLIRASYIDITDRKKAEKEIFDMKNYLSIILNSLPVIIIGIDGSGGVTQWNKESEVFTGIKSDIAEGQKLDAVLPNFSRYIINYISDLNRSGFLKMEKIIIRKNSGVAYFDLMVLPLSLYNTDGFVIRIEDVTERSKLQDMMIQTEKMITVGGLAAGMAHEINNPLGIITQSAQNIERRFSPDLPGNRAVSDSLNIDLNKISEYMEKRDIYKFIVAIKDASMRAAKIITNTLSFSRRSISEKEEINIVEIIDKSIELAVNDYDLNRKYDFRDIKILKEYEAPVINVFAVDIEIEQVVLNLLKNSAQALTKVESDFSATIILRIKNENLFVVIEIEDNGPGMTENIRQRIFEPFFTTKDLGEGTGLGLSVSYSIITNNHKGSIEVESELGVGTKFIIKLPK